MNELLVGILGTGVGVCLDLSSCVVYLAWGPTGAAPPSAIARGGGRVSGRWKMSRFRRSLRMLPFPPAGEGGVLVGVGGATSQWFGLVADSAVVMFWQA